MKAKFRLPPKNLTKRKRVRKLLYHLLKEKARKLLEMEFGNFAKELQEKFGLTKKEARELEGYAFTLAQVAFSEVLAEALKKLKKKRSQE